MSVRNLDYLFRPKSIAVVGASNRPRSIGTVVMRNLLGGGFSGPILPVNPKEASVAGVLAYSDVKDLPLTPDMAVICTPPHTIPGIIAELGSRGTRAAVVITAGLEAVHDEKGRTIQQAVLDIAKPNLLRVLGHNCVGIISPNSGVNASFSHVAALPGRIAFVTQSGAMAVSVLDWARSTGVGFSHFVSLGNCVDVDFGDTLDYLGSDAETNSILLYMESLGADEARKFMSAARAAARNKPVIVVKSGRAKEGAKAAASHTGALAGSDDVYDAAFRRAGMLRVVEVDELFDAVETLGRATPYKGDRLAIVTNGGGPGVLATDALVKSGGRLAALSNETMEKLNSVLPPTWSKANPIDIIGDAMGDRYATTLEIVLADRGVDAVLVMNVPTAVTSSTEAAESVIETVKRSRVPIFTCWLGRDGVEPARIRLRASGVPTYETPDNAVRAFMHTVEYRRNQDSLMQVPPSVPREFQPEPDVARGLIRKRLAEGIEILSEVDAKAVLAAYGVPVLETRIARNADEAIRLCKDIGYPAAVKIHSPQITHKSDVGGVKLNIESPEELATVINEMGKHVKERRPDATISGFAVQSMVRRPNAHELIVGAVTDSIFGPTILFGQGGIAVEVIQDRAVALPPLNMALARELISRTRVSRLLKGYRDRPAADLEAISVVLIQVAQLVSDIPEIIELDINPLLADESGVLALDARIRIAESAMAGPDRLAIRPYPSELEETVTLENGMELLVRPIRPEDRPAHERFVARLTPEDLRSRFLAAVREIPPSQMARLTQIDYEREMGFIAVTPDADPPETLGVVRIATDPDNTSAEFAIAVRSDMKGHGLGHALMKKIIRYCKARGNREVVGDVLADNRAMLSLARDLNFTVEGQDADVVRIRLALG